MLQFPREQQPSQPTQQQELRWKWGICGVALNTLEPRFRSTATVRGEEFILIVRNSKMNGGGSGFGLQRKSQRQSRALAIERTIDKNLREQGFAESAQERADIKLEKAEKLRKWIALMVLGAVVFVAFFLPMMAVVQYNDVVKIWNKYKPPYANVPSGTHLALALKFPFLAKTFFLNPGMATAMYICVRVPAYSVPFSKNPGQYTADMWSSQLWGNYSNDPANANMQSALDVICNGWGTKAGIDQCLPVCPPGQGNHASDYVSSGVSMGLTGAMVLAPVLPPFGFIAGLVIGGGVGHWPSGMGTQVIRCPLQNLKSAHCKT